MEIQFDELKNFTIDQYNYLQQRIKLTKGIYQMAVFRLSQDDINRGKLVDPNEWYRYRVEKVYDEPTKDKTSTNTKVDCRIMLGKFEGLVVTRTFNEKAPGFIVPFLAAFKVDVQPDQSYDLAKLENREFLGFTTHREWNNSKFNDIVDFRPVD